MENSSVADSEKNRADEAVLEALLEDAKKAPGEAELEALLAKTQHDISGGESALTALLAKTDKKIAEKNVKGSAKQDESAAGQKVGRERQMKESGSGHSSSQADKSDRSAESSRSARASRGASSIKTEMLLVHADSTQRSVLEMSFISEGYNVVNFETGKEALHYLKTNVPDIMLLDADMEKLTGMDICFRIRKIKRFETVPVIIMTEANDDKTETMIKMCHANDYFPKSNKNIELKAKVRKLLEKSDVEKLTQVDLE